MFICTVKWHCTLNRLLSMVASFAMLPVNMQIIYATSLWKRRLWSNGFLSERLQNYKCKVILVRCHQSVFWNSLIPTNMPALTTAFRYPTITIYQRRPLGSIPRDSSFNVKAELSTAELTEQAPLRKDSRLRHTGIRIIMLLKFKQKAEARAKAKAVWNRGEKRDLDFISASSRWGLFRSTFLGWANGHWGAISCLSQSLSLSNQHTRPVCQRETMGWTYLLELRDSHDSGLEMLGDIFTNVNKNKVQ